MTQFTRILNLKDKIDELEERIATLQADVENAKGLIYSDMPKAPPTAEVMLEKQYVELEALRNRLADYKRSFAFMRLGLNKRIRGFNKRWKWIVALKIDTDMTFTEIARQTKVNRKTVYNVLKKAGYEREY